MLAFATLGACGGLASAGGPADTGSASGGASGSLAASGVATGTSGGVLAATTGAASATGLFISSGAPTAVDAAPASWTSLYQSFFGNPNTGGCGSIKNVCHLQAGDQGAVQWPNSGFVCETTAAQCYQGMLDSTPSLLPTGPLSDVTDNPLWQSLYMGGLERGTSNNMPLVGYVPTANDLALIKTWLEEGAPDN